MFSHFPNLSGVMMGVLAGFALGLAFIAAGLRGMGRCKAKRVALLSLLMTAGVLGLRAIPPSPPANAPLPPRQAVAVLRFGSLCKAARSPAVSLAATQAIVRELNRSPHYLVTVPPEDARNVSATGLMPETTTHTMRLLGRQWGVDAFVAGDVLDVSFTEKPHCAHVTLSVRILDTVIGDFVNGVVVTGNSGAARPAVEADDSALIRQAVTDTARNALSVIDAYTFPEASVLSVNGTEELTLNLGKKDGLQLGQEMIIIRGRECMGCIRVRSTESATATAVILDTGKGIRPGDHARTIFNLPGYNVFDGSMITTGSDTVIHLTAPTL